MNSNWSANLKTLMVSKNLHLALMKLLARTTGINFKAIEDSISPTLNNNFWNIVIGDILATYRRDPTCSSLIGCITKPGFKATFLYRLSTVVGSSLSARLLKFIDKHYKTKISNTTRIGRSFTLCHPSGVSLEGLVLIGDNVMIAGNVVLGLSEHKTGNCPTIIHSGCNIGSNSIILNTAEVGHCCKINPLSVVSGWILPCNHVSGVPVIFK
ncbi:Serine acetyltransferase [Candidatus Hodgkinia cicadicola]|uniref:Serine acetyltransferase n=1 Tax=Candidatus Hodgkinia cicadicola TaxID=573658 RepID=A0ABX4MHF2_9HYPH|nr:Serine acetyltransferase [Candidatus Hodgkinia cicadicola]